jgi:hypothetical protein
MAGLARPFCLPKYATHPPHKTRPNPMDTQSFRDSTNLQTPPEGLSFALQALWWDAKGDWDKAHECAQARDDAAGMSVHAYLHRKEGDQDNAGYWYRRVRKPPATATLEEEWEDLARALLAEV